MRLAVAEGRGQETSFHVSFFLLTSSAPGVIVTAQVNEMVLCRWASAETSGGGVETWAVPALVILNPVRRITNRRDLARQRPKDVPRPPAPVSMSETAEAHLEVAARPIERTLRARP